ncbi:unnamed protein product [Adineta steineri]|uniref:Uncharacterized protein n=1 Tax=Adineta steineri TaxID=433720 RepID=A0A814U8H5_9BILA|nr:unnamed protein product [Adineta steineri]CAF3858873.1 unnamed protein product [Adineta steineri]
MDETSLISEQIQENKKSIHKLSRDFRLKATQLYLKIVKEESKFQHEKFEKVLNDFLQHEAQKTPSSSSTFGRVDERDDNNRKHFDVHSDKEDDDVDEFFTQRKAPPSSSPQRHTKSMNKEEEREDVE